MDAGKSKIMALVFFILAIAGAVGTMVMMNSNISKVLVYVVGGVAIILLFAGIFSYFNYKKLHDAIVEAEKKAEKLTEEKQVDDSEE